MSLFGIGVALSHRKTGVGMRLLQAFEEKARTLEMQSLVLWVYQDKIATRRLYEKCGWRPCPTALGLTSAAKYVRLVDDQGIKTQGFSMSASGASGLIEDSFP